MDEQKEINSKLDHIIEKNTSNDSMTEEKFTELLEERNNDYNLDSILECNDLYEYDVVTVHDSHGRTDTNSLKKTLIRYSVQGWRLKTAFTNEIGSNMVGGAIVGVGVGTIFMALFTGSLTQYFIDQLQCKYQFVAKTNVGKKLEEIAAIKTK